MCLNIKDSFITLKNNYIKMADDLKIYEEWANIVTTQYFAYF